MRRGDRAALFRTVRKAVCHAHPDERQPPRRRPQPGHPRPRRRRQDHRHRADPVRDRRHAPARGGARRHHRHRLRPAGTRPGHHHLRRRRQLRLGRSPRQPHRHPGPRRLRRRGGALAAGPRRRGRRVRRGRRGRTAERVGVAAGGPARRAADRVRQQDGPGRCRARRRRRLDPGAAAPRTPRGPAADRCGGRLHGRRRPGPDAGADLGQRRWGRQRGPGAGRAACRGPPAAPAAGGGRRRAAPGSAGGVLRHRCARRRDAGVRPARPDPQR
ncbi:hypothetical protein SGRIM128S_09400 [Streptomyces griseomycini]